ncbi:ArsR/SmtB family transcription factor [Defluviimonas sp. SAOS-178_SWC]|uniref:ArsR/SmtB family transcription factor n=1 Tax=Defluviimonas sp. SAOS-178_SWC TaxID=3121287 RepID=UPI00322186BB
MTWPFEKRRGSDGGAPRPEPAAGVAAAEDLVGQADEAAGYLKALAHEGRLMILCHLIDGEKSVTELETLLASRQAAVSQQLARLRLEGLVKARRDGKAIYYSLSDPRTARMIGLLNELFCRQA